LPSTFGYHAKMQVGAMPLHQARCAVKRVSLQKASGPGIAFIIFFSSRKTRVEAKVCIVDLTRCHHWFVAF
jgi:hypothetical protein